MSSRFMKVDELTELLDVSPSWVYARTRPNSDLADTPPFKRFGKHLRFDRAEIAEWMAQRPDSRANTSGIQPEGTPDAPQTIDNKE